MSVAVEGGRARPGLDAVWPGPSAPIPRLTGLGAVAAGVAGALLLPAGVPGVGVLLTGLVVTAATVPAARRRVGLHEIGWGGLALSLLAVVAVRDAPDVVALCLVAAIGLGSYALAGGRTWTGLLLGSASTALAGLRMPVCLLRGLAASRLGGGARAGVVRGTLAAFALVLVFGALFRAADAAFAAQLDPLLPDLAIADLPVRVFVFVGVAAFASRHLCSRPHHHAGTGGLPLPGVVAAALNGLFRSRRSTSSS